MIASTFLVCLASFVFVVLLTILCLGRKKKKVVTTAATVEENDRRLSRRRSSTTVAAGGEDGYASIDIMNPNIAAVGPVAGQTRVLPKIPSQVDTTTGNLPRPNSRSEHSSLGSGELARRHSNSPKAEQTKTRKLPSPPDADNKDAAAATVQMNDGEDDVTNVYANVDEEKQAPQRRKIRTLDIKEGSGDSSFYAKVGDVVEEVGGEMLYAQVNDDLPTTVQPPSLPIAWTTDEPLLPAASPPLPKPNSMKQQIYQDEGGPEYATIDKLNKKSPTASQSSNQSTIASGGDVDEMEAPPIPDRNFIEDTDDDELDYADDPHADIPHIDDDDEDIEGKQEASKGVVYDKLCVRESLDHLRNRKEVECQRRAKYANIQEDGVDVTQDQTAVYAQIDENVAEEAVYESVSGSGDGSFQPQPIPVLPPQPPTPQPALPQPQHHHRPLTNETSFSSSNRSSNNNNITPQDKHNSHMSRHHYEQIRGHKHV